VDSTVLGGQLLVLAITIGAAAYWWWSVVPSARRTLAKEKRAGPLNEYLVELQQNPDKGVERWFYTDWLQQLQRRQQLAAQAAAKRAAASAGASAATANAASTAAAIADAATAGQQEQVVTELGSAADGVAAGSEQQQQLPQLPPPTQEPYVDKEPNFWSLDNPLLATAAMLAAIGMVSTLLHGIR
jgi:cytoskeletal protein RodZ